MAGHGRDWRAARAEERRAVRRIHNHQDAAMMRTILAGGHPCDACGAYSVRFSAELGERVCGECGHVNRKPAA